MVDAKKFRDIYQRISGMCRKKNERNFAFIKKCFAKVCEITRTKNVVPVYSSEARTIKILTLACYLHAAYVLLEPGDARVVPVDVCRLSLR
jgi:hypothetical protein